MYNEISASAGLSLAITGVVELLVCDVFVSFSKCHTQIL